MAREKLTAKAILAVLDAAASEFDFPMLDNGYVYPVDIRLSAFGDGTRWAVVFEWMGVQNRAGCFSNALYAYGNALRAVRTEADFVSSEAYRTWRANHQFRETREVEPVGDGPSAPLIDPDGFLTVNPRATDLRIRDRVVALPRDPAAYAARCITLEKPPALQLHELMRCLAPDHRELLLATEDELHRLVPRDLPLLLRLDEWRHPDLSDDEPPSDTEAFRMIADVLVHADAGRYRPTESPNTHWSNWPMGGAL